MSTKFTVAGWRATRRLGEGATSEVWEGQDDAGHRAALKVGRRGQDSAQLLAEARRCLWLRSPVLPSLLGVGWVAADGQRASGARPCIVLTWAAGQPLSELQPKDESAALSLALVVARDVGTALAQLHQLGQAHGDVKPANVIVDWEGSPSPRARLVDLGLGESLELTHPRGGTPRYLAPEVTSQSGSDGRSRDLWAFGRMLLEVLPDTGATGYAASERLRVLRELAQALSAEQPMMRPSPEWAARTARRLLGAEDDGNLTVEARRASVRHAYLEVRRSQVLAAARARRAQVAVGGLPGEWLSGALNAARQLEQLSGAEPTPTETTLTDCTPIEIASWLLRLAGPIASAWPHPQGDGGDALLAERLWQLAETTPLEGLVPSQLVGPAAIAAAESATLDPYEIIAALQNPPVARPWLDAALRLAERPDCPPTVRVLLARQLRARGDYAESLAVLPRGVGSGRLDAERAETLRRARLSEEARACALPLSRCEDPETRSLASAVLGRLMLDAGQLSESRQWVESAPPSAASLEVLALVDTARGELGAARDALLQARAQPLDEERRGRLLAIEGNIEHRAGHPERALQCLQGAADAALRNGATLEEATYLTGVAAAASDAGHLGVALSAALRATLLFEHLDLEALAARAALGRASVLAQCGEGPELREALAQVESLARRGGDKRCQAFAYLLQCDLADPAAARDYLERAQSLLDAGDGDDRLQSGARALRLGVQVDRAALDALARDPARDVSARLLWWAERALVALANGPSEEEPALLAALLGLVNEEASVAERGRALFAGARLAAARGQGETVRRLSAAARRDAAALIERAPAELKPSVRRQHWVDQLEQETPSELAPQQLQDIEQLVRGLAERGRLEPLLSQILDALVLWTGVERGLLLLTAPGGRLMPRTGRNLSRRDLTGEQLTLSRTLAERAARTREPVVAMDASGELSDTAQSVHALALRSVLAVPLVARGNVLGVVYLDDRMRIGAFGKPELAWVRLVASVAAVALDDARNQLLLRRAARKAARREKAALQREEVARTEAVQARRELRTLGVRSQGAFARILGNSDAIRRAVLLAERVATSELGVLVLGESGSGKELFARAIHDAGKRAGRPFVSENCSAIPEPLLESTLFGHARGAFTGATRAHLGLFEVADGGTLFLDEIGEMSLAMQAKLLRVLEDGSFRPVGAESERSIDVRVIGATHRDIKSMILAGRFREDLYYRLSVVELRVPPLRERPEDIPGLVRHFAEQQEPGRGLRFSAAALEALSRFSWPGNVRQLQNEVRRALVLAEGEVQPEHLSADIAGRAAEVPGKGDLRSRLDALERQLVSEALSRFDGNQTKAAAELGISRFGLQKMVKRLAIGPLGTGRTPGEPLSKRS